LGEVIKKARQHAPHTLKIEVEVESVEQAQEALSAGADIIMLDNMDLEDMRRVVELAQGRAVIEASGRITLDSVRAVADTGVDLISVGALTHSAKALDISLELETR
jgi:nicotinate-nucleotide pyrophosphorylase (carboxylating)